MAKWKPPPKLTVSQWADRYRQLSPESSAEPGKWRTARAEYQRAIMDAFNDDDAHTIVWMSSSQVGKTEVLNNILGYVIDQSPSPVLVVQPTIEMGKTWSKDRFAPMLRDTPCLRGLVGERRAKDSENTILHKVFPGGFCAIAGSNSSASLASRPVRLLLADEVDRYPESAGSEGDPLNLAFKRTTTFHNRKRIVVSTPTVAGESRIEMAFAESDQQHYYVPCPHCDTYQRLYWKNVSWPEGKPHDACYACEHCGGVIKDADKPKMLANGEWRPEAEFHGTRGFHINEIYSPWVRFGEMAASFMDAKKQPATLQTWINTALGEVWQEEGEELDQDALENRREDLTAIPDDVLLLTVSVDTQDDRLEAQLVGWGVDHESWCLEHHVWWGDPGQAELWKRLHDYLGATFTRADGTTLRVSATAIDSGGHFTEQVYRFTKGKHRVYAIKGVGGAGRPIAGRPSKANKRKVQVWPVGVDTAKELLFSRLKIDKAGPGCVHFDAKLDQEWFAQLTSEKRVEVRLRGAISYRYKQLRKRNEALDLLVYAIAACELLNPNFAALAGDAPEPKPKPERKQNWIQRRPRTSGWVRGAR